MSGLEIVFLSSSALNLVSGVIILLLNPWRMINRSYFIAAVLSSLWLGCIFVAIRLGRHEPEVDSEIVLGWVRLSSAIAGLLPWSYFLVKESSTQAISARRILLRSWPWALTSIVLAILAYSDTYFSAPPDNSGHHQRGQGYQAYLALFVVVCGLLLHSSLSEARRRKGLAQLELRFLAVNLGLAGVTILALFASSRIFEVSWPRYAGPYVLAISNSFTIWAICYYRVFDAKEILLAVAERALLLCGAGLLVLLPAIHFADSSTYPAVVFGATVLASVLALRLDKLLKRLFRLDPTQELRQTRQRIIDWARRETDSEKLTRNFAELLADRCATSYAALLVPRGETLSGGSLSLPTDWAGLEPLCREGWITPEALHRQRRSGGFSACMLFLHENQLGALLAVPRGSTTPSLIIALSQKHSLRPYTYPDIQVLLELAELMDNILTHAHVAARNAEIERMESAAMMSRGLAHDLNNLATPVSTFLLHMEGRVSAGSPEAEVLSDAKRSIRVMQDYIRESLFFSRSLTPRIQKQSSLELLTSTAEAAQARAREQGVMVVVERGPEIAFNADRVLMLRLLQNLVFNGIDATPAGGKVTLAASIDAHDWVIFRVTDEGPGVPPELVGHIFEPYFTTKDTGDSHRGLGLGLAISLKIGALHRGTIRVERAISGGAIFLFKMPHALREG